MNDKIELGMKCRDTITGFTGITTIQTEYRNGCLRLVLESADRNSDGEVIPACIFDIQQLEIVDSTKPSIKIVRSSIKMNAEVKDIVTGIEGVVVAISTVLGGLPEIGIQPKKLKTDGAPANPHFFTENRIQIIQDAEAKEEPKKRTGGPQSLEPTLPGDRIR
ncbi:MAG: hypothetical protein UT05_C0015G0016 [Parcubacteria group bacterium GW2011_GWF2_38_76]|nr:MAG: hypothetical protein UT05_C0015G0016 [Parcubacteria group bacterium GW2011_GWF2_38_76]